MKTKKTEWKWDKVLQELDITVTTIFPDNYPQQRKVSIPREQAVEMIKELHNDLEFEEYYDLYCHKAETTGG